MNFLQACKLLLELTPGHKNQLRMKSDLLALRSVLLQWKLRWRGFEACPKNFIFLRIKNGGIAKLEIALDSLNKPSSTSGLCLWHVVVGTEQCNNESISYRALFVAQLVEQSPLKPKDPQFESHSRENGKYIN